MDLLQAFGSWERYGGSVDLDQFLRDNLGVDSAAANNVGLGYHDVLADADAFLCGTRPRGTLWSENLRGGLGQSSPTDRIRRFGELRLGMSVVTTRSVLAQVYDGLDALGVNIGLTRVAILKMASANRTPTIAETEVIVSRFIDCLSRLS